ncbi:MAG: TipAS antibiotic-recognition domain-containing protein [Roseburia sp.]|nr:TipAS antibiotic-recognition domain-containing protein [Roseburia sp.]MCM1279874.1 TipAS antibiotic-recognition domain-containing protein [Robinsoniella sp.]
MRILLDFLAFDTNKLNEYAKQAKASYGQSKEYKEFVEKSKNWVEEDVFNIQMKFRGIFIEFIEFGKINDKKLLT